ncbi:MAG: LicD family protein [Ruminococcus sp.]|nr:LicD family protein [Ruminococcus sp.]
MLTDKQKHLYTLYKEVDSLCRKHNIRYQLAGGTLIGAVRHRGFIPWDDDMDITMTRDNWDRFVEVCKTELPDDRILECQELNHNFHNVIARYTDKTSSAVHSTQVLFNDTAGDMIDIICYDYLPNNGKAWRQYTKDITLYSDLINPCIVYSYRFCCNQFRYGWYRIKMRFQGKDKVLDDLQKKMFSYREEDCPYVVLRWGGTPLIFRKEIFGESSNEVLFEDTMGEAPDLVSDYIVEHYEDEWMFVPPATEQSGHNSIYSLDTDYKTIRKEIFSIIDAEKEKKKFLRKKAFAMQIMAPWLVLKNGSIVIDKFKQSRNFRANFENKRAEIDSAFNKNRFDVLEEIFSDFIGVQFNKYYFGRDNYDDVYKYRHPVVIKIDNDIADKIILTLFNRNAISKAYRMITVYEQRNCATDFMREVKSDIHLFRKAVHNVSVEKYENAYDITVDLLAKYPCSIGVVKLMIYVLRYLGINKNRNKIEALIEQGLGLYSDDGELLKLNLDLDYPKMREKLVPQYIDAFHKTLNGLTRLDIQDIVAENMDFFDSAKKAEDALSVLPDSKSLCKKFINLTVENGSLEDIYSLFNFAQEKQEVLGDEFDCYFLKICSFFIGEKYAELFRSVMICEDFAQLEKIEQTVKSFGEFENSVEIQLLLGDIFYKKGLTTKAVEAYAKSAAVLDNKDKKLTFILGKRFTSELKNLKSQFDSADSLIYFDVSTGKEKPAEDEKKNRVKLAYFSKWCEPFDTVEELLTILEKLGMASKISAEKFTIEYMAKLLDKLEISSNYLSDETDEDSLKALKLEGPLPSDKNLTVV